MWFHFMVILILVLLASALIPCLPASAKVSQVDSAFEDLYLDADLASGFLPAYG